MVRALLDGSKTQTRRALKLRPGFDLEERDDGRLWPWAEHPDHDADIWMPSPYGQPGERLWVRETFFAFGRWETRFSAKKGRDEWHFVDMTQETGREYCFEASGPAPAALISRRGAGVTPSWWKRPAIFMPRAACRLLLEITDVRVERLQSISEADAQAEGAPGYEEGVDPPPPDEEHEWSYRASFERLWGSINGADSWAANPWVWAVSFKRVGSTLWPATK